MAHAGQYKTHMGRIGTYVLTGILSRFFVAFKGFPHPHMSAIYLCIYPSGCLPACLSACLSFCPSASLPCLSVCLSDCCLFSVRTCYLFKCTAVLTLIKQISTMSLNNVLKLQQNKSCQIQPSKSVHLSIKVCTLLIV